MSGFTPRKRHLLSGHFVVANIIVVGMTSESRKVWLGCSYIKRFLLFTVEVGSSLDRDYSITEIRCQETRFEALFLDHDIQHLVRGLQNGQDMAKKKGQEKNRDKKEIPRTDKEVA